jgi:hypothetical protein
VTTTSPADLDVRAEIAALLDGQSGGILATLGADGGPHLVYVLTAATDALEIVFASLPTRDHSGDIARHGRVAFLCDNRDQVSIKETPALFLRVEARGPIELVGPPDPDYPAITERLTARHPLVLRFLENGAIVFRIRPDVMTLRRGGAEKWEYRPAAAGCA